MTESLCLLYVAMTRAKRSLIMIIQPANKSTFDTKTAASLVFHALAPETDPKLGNTVLYQHGVVDWCEVAPESDDSELPRQRIGRPIKFLTSLSTTRHDQKLAYQSIDGD